MYACSARARGCRTGSQAQKQRETVSLCPCAAVNRSTTAAVNRDDTTYGLGHTAARYSLQPSRRQGRQRRLSAALASGIQPNFPRPVSVRSFPATVLTSLTAAAAAAAPPSRLRVPLNIFEKRIKKKRNVLTADTTVPRELRRRPCVSCLPGNRYRFYTYLRIYRLSLFLSCFSDIRRYRKRN